MQPVARYREFDPCHALRGYVRSFFTFTVPAETGEPRRPVRRERLYDASGSYTTPLFADSHVSISFSFGAGYRVDGLWNQADAKHCGHVIGPMSAAHAAAHGEQIVQLGAYFHPVWANCFLATSGRELTDRILPLSDLWGNSAVSLESGIAEAGSDEQRVDLLERALLQRLRFLSPDRRFAVDIPALAEFVLHRRGMVTVSELADSTGVSRQHLGRIFREVIGLPPKLFCRLARFRAALASAGEGKQDGAGLAAELGYVDQSHMIAEFREFSGLTPMPLLLHQRIHPFLGFDNSNPLSPDSRF